MSGQVVLEAVENALQAGYRFSRHGQSVVYTDRRRSIQHHRSRESSCTPKAPYSVSDAESFDLRTFASPGNLNVAWQVCEREGGGATGVDRLSYEDYSVSDRFRVLRVRGDQIRSKLYVPQRMRRKSIPKPTGDKRKLEIPTIEDRVIAKAFQMALDPFWRPRLPMFANSSLHLFADMQNQIQRTRSFFLTVRDIKNFFPSVPISSAILAHARHISNPDLLWLIETICRGHDGVKRTTGLAQGSPYSPVAAECVLHGLESGLDAQRREFFLFRYVDNINILTRSAQEGLETIERYESILSPDMRLKKAKTMVSPMDLREEDRSRNVLGLNPSWRDGRLVFQIPEEAFRHLKSGLLRSQDSERPDLVSKNVIRGWINAVSPALTVAAEVDITGRIMQIARTSRFNEIQMHDLRELCLSARRRWNECCARVRNR